MKALNEISLPINEKEYRELDYQSYSLLSSISRLGVNALTNEFKPSYATKFGILTESLLFDDYVEEDYYITNVYLPEGKLHDACDIIFTSLLETEDKLHFNLESHTEAIITILNNNNIDYWSKKEDTWRAAKIIKESKEFWVHFVKSIGKILITPAMLAKAKSTVYTLKTHEFTKDIFSISSFFNVEKESQVKLIFNYHGHAFKCMLDWLVIDHDNKVIKPYDLKTGGKYIEEFPDSFYYWRYDIQAFLYKLAIIHMKNEFYPDYVVDDFKFIYISRNDVSKPIIWSVGFNQAVGTSKGFTRNGVYYKGVDELIKEFVWYSGDKERQYSEDIYKSNGELHINGNIIINNGES